MTTLAYTRTGAGAPLVLLHGLGSSRQVWDPVLPALAERFDVIAVDLPGFGASAALSEEPTPAALARAVSDFLDGQGISTPHLAGNSLGGWVALELAGLRACSGVTLLSPAGLWRRDTPLYCRASLVASRWLAEHASGVLARLVDYRVGRLLILGQTHGRPGALTPAQARAGIHALGSCPGFAATRRATTHRRYVASRSLTAPVTLAFGSRDLLLLKRQSRSLRELPAGTALGSLPRCGHLPMNDNPAAVVALIAAGAAQPSAAATACASPLTR